MIDKDIIDKALNFYNIDLQYRDKCYNLARNKVGTNIAL